MIHYIVNWLFIILTTIHVYLSVTEDFPAFLNFFGLGGVEEAVQEKKDKKYGTTHEGGHGDDHGGDKRQAPARAGARPLVRDIGSTVGVGGR